MFEYCPNSENYKYIDHAGNVREAVEVDLEEFCYLTHAYMGLRREGRYEYVYYWPGVTRFNIDDESITYYKRLISLEEYERFLRELEG